jgi:hypothetical protein
MRPTTFGKWPFLAAFEEEKKTVVSFSDLEPSSSFLPLFLSLFPLLGRLDSKVRHRCFFPTNGFETWWKKPMVANRVARWYIFKPKT